MDARPRFAGTLIYDPGSDAADRYPDWVIRHRNIGGVIPEVLCRRRKVIIIGTGQNNAARRCSLAHAIAHLDLGHAEALSVDFEKREELEADKLAGTRLITLDQLAVALRWTRVHVEIAAELDVDVQILKVREKYLSADERQYLRGRVHLLNEEIA